MTSRERRLERRSRRRSPPGTPSRRRRSTSRRRADSPPRRNGPASASGSSVRTTSPTPPAKLDQPNRTIDRSSSGARSKTGRRATAARRPENESSPAVAASCQGQPRRLILLRRPFECLVEVTLSAPTKPTISVCHASTSVLLTLFDLARRLASFTQLVTRRGPQWGTRCGRRLQRRLRAPPQATTIAPHRLGA